MLGLCSVLENPGPGRPALREGSGAKDPQCHYFDRAFVTAGGLVSYAPDRIDLYRRAAGYVDRILKGEKPADMPVQAPTRYQLVINLKTAESLGLDVPVYLQQTADEIIE